MSACSVTPVNVACLEGRHKALLSTIILAPLRAGRGLMPVESYLFFFAKCWSKTSDTFNRLELISLFIPACQSLWYLLDSKCL